MTSCRHTDWIEVSCSSRHVRLADPGRLDRLVRKLEQSTRQFPQVVLCIGKEERRKLVTQTVLNRTTRVTRSTNASAAKQSSGGLTSIFSDDSQWGTDHPIFFADYRLGRALPETIPHRCHETKFARSVWPLGQADIHDTVLTRLLFPFSDVVCLFADDLGGVDAVLDLIEIWSAAKSATDLADFAAQALPRVCVITSGSSTPGTQIQEEAWRARLDTAQHFKHFSSVQVLRFDRDNDTVFHKNFRFLIVNELKASRVLKKKHQIQFNADHLTNFFSQAILHLAANSDRKFSFLEASRAYRPVPFAYREQIRVLLHTRAKHRIGFDHIATLIASCLLLDAYPNACHSTCLIREKNHSRRRLTRAEFRAGDLFQGLYAGHVETALESGHAVLLFPGEKCQRKSAIEDKSFKISVKFIKLAIIGFTKHGTEDWALRQHRETLKKLQHCIDTKALISAEICVSCLTGPPQHVLICGHTLCDLCVHRFGSAVTGEESRYLLDTCAVCEAHAKLTVYLKPATAGLRMLNIDGGGVRGVVPLEFLTRLQNELGPRARVQDFFDIAFGTSAGMLTSCRSVTSLCVVRPFH